MWFKVDDGFHASKKLLRIPRAHRLEAAGLWVIGGSWAGGQETDGHIPDYMIEEWGGRAETVDWLIKSGLWEAADDGAMFTKWAEYQPTHDDLEAKREHWREKKRSQRRNERGQFSNVPEGRSGDTPETPSGNSEESNRPVPSRPDSSSDDEEGPTRDDVNALCTTLRDLMVSNGFKAPRITKAWKDEARRLLDNDGRELDKALNVMRWAAASSFWRPNIKSMAKFRQQYDTLRLQALDEWQRGKGNPQPQSVDGDIDVDAILGKDYWQPGAPPSGLSLQEEIEWKREQRQARAAARLAEATAKVGGGDAA